MIRFGICDDNYRYMQRAGEIICAKFDELKTFDENAPVFFIVRARSYLDVLRRTRLIYIFLILNVGKKTALR